MKVNCGNLTQLTLVNTSIRTLGSLVQSSVIFGTEPKSRYRLKVTFLHVNSVHEKEELYFLSFEDSATS